MSFTVSAWDIQTHKKVGNPLAYKTAVNILTFNYCDLIKICKYVRMSKWYTQCQFKQEDDTALSWY